MGFVEELFGSNLIHGDKPVDSKDLEGKYLAIYFSAHWCPPCRGFTPTLIKFYEHLKTTRNDFEFVFVSSDKDESSFNEYYKEMPWLALDFKEREKKSEISSKYNVSGIPTLVVVDKDGKTLTTGGRSKVMSDPNGEEFPWIPKPLDQVIGNNFLNNKHEPVQVDLKGKVFGLYFSAHWCPPCKAFTPIFAQTYEKLKQEGKDFEVVFVSSDRDNDSFEHYSSEMPWISIPFSDQKRKDELNEIFEVEGIPSLVIIDKDLSILNDNGVAAIRGGDLEYPFKPAILSKLSSSNISEVNGKSSLFIVVHEEEATSVSEQMEQVKKYLEPVVAKLDSDKKTSTSFKIFYTSSNDETFKMVANFANIQSSNSNTMFILDIPKQKKYISQQNQFNSDNFQAFVDDFIAQKLTPLNIRS